MWLGMLSGIVGQLPALPVEPLNWLNSLCLAYIAQVARWLAAPDWALLEVKLATPWAVAVRLPGPGDRDGGGARAICAAEAGAALGALLGRGPAPRRSLPWPPQRCW